MWSIFLHLVPFLMFYEPTASMQIKCSVIDEYYLAESRCIETNSSQTEDLNGTDVGSPGCPKEWYGMICWPESAVGEVVNRSCPSFLDPYLRHKGVLYRNCTEQGWSKLIPHFKEACEMLNNTSGPQEHYSLLTLRQVYTAGYATSLIALVTAIIIFTAFRKFHCNRNYIHMNLFISFILRATSVFIKDIILFSNDIDQCSTSTVTCKGAIAFFHYCILANISWLLVEGLYLQTLLSLTFVSHAKYFWCYCLIGWGSPTIVLTIWIFTKLFVENEGCWDDNKNVYIWWIIKGAIFLSVLVNFLIFLSIIRILIQKLGSPAVGGNSRNQFSRLTKSTLLLIPLLGIHYMVCLFLPDHVAPDLKLGIELGLGSFQGFLVALLYCFLNTEVLAELKRRLRLCRPEGLPDFTKRQSRSTSTDMVGNSSSTQVVLLEKLIQKGSSPEYNGSF